MHLLEARVGQKVKTTQALGPDVPLGVSILWCRSFKIDEEATVSEINNDSVLIITGNGSGCDPENKYLRVYSTENGDLPQLELAT
ncbi:MAG: hypothetical protein ABIH67_03710 [Candidatus Uhrbacteria bacterium]